MTPEVYWSPSVGRPIEQVVDVFVWWTGVRWRVVPALPVDAVRLTDVSALLRACDEEDVMHGALAPETIRELLGLDDER